MKPLNHKDQDALYTVLAALQSPEETRRFLADLCTPGEVAAFAERWAIARMLDEGNAGYRDIAARTSASTTTVGRVARSLFQEDQQGYRALLDRLYPKK